MGSVGLLFQLTTAAAAPVELAPPGNCWPLTSMVGSAVRSSRFHRAVAVFVEDRGVCREGGAPQAAPDLPVDLHGRALLDWCIAAAARLPGAEPHILVQRGDAWLISPTVGERVFDRPVVVPKGVPTLEEAVMGLQSQLGPGYGMRAAWPVYVLGGSQPNDVDSEGLPLLETLRLLYRPHELPEAPIGYLVMEGGGTAPLYNSAEASEPAVQPDLPFEVPATGTVSVFRTPEGAIVAQPTVFRVPAGWVPAPEAIRTSPDGAPKLSPD